MIDHVWSILCSQAVIDIDSNNISIHNVIEQILIKAVPARSGILPIHLELVSFWTRANVDAPAKGKSRVNFVSPSEKATQLVAPEIDLSTTERSRNRVKIDGIQVEESGRHYFRVEVREDNDKWREVASIPLTIVFSPPDEDVSNNDSA